MPQQTAQEKKAAADAAAAVDEAAAATAEYDRLEERVLMRHPEIPHTAEQPVEMTRRQLEVVYAPSGWVEVDPADAPAAAAAIPSAGPVIPAPETPSTARS